MDAQRRPFYLQVASSASYTAIVQAAVGGARARSCGRMLLRTKRPLLALIMAAMYRVVAQWHSTTIISLLSAC